MFSSDAWSQWRRGHRTISSQWAMRLGKNLFEHFPIERKYPIIYRQTIMFIYDNKSNTKDRRHTNHCQQIEYIEAYLIMNLKEINPKNLHISFLSLYYFTLCMFIIIPILVPKLSFGHRSIL